MTFFCGFPCLLGLTILLLQTIFAGKKSNEKWKMESTKQIRSIRPIRGQKSNPPPPLPFREGQGVGFFSSRSTVNPQDWCFKCFKCFGCFISLLDQKIARFWSKSEQNRCFSCSKCSASTRSAIDVKGNCEL